MKCSPTYLLCFLLGFPLASGAQKISELGKGWAANTINTAVFRKNALASDGHMQYAAYYDSAGHVVLACRRLTESRWTIQQTTLSANVGDAHNSISIAVDGEGYLHLSWDQHAGRLRYCRSVRQGSLELTPEMPMTGIHETKCTYPEFYRLRNGDLLFLYRDGASGNGNLLLNHYHLREKKWEQVQSNLLDGEGKRNAYWQACIDSEDVMHLSWVWRESSDVSTNHDLCYARSADGGKTWTRSDRLPYTLPINRSTAEKIVSIPEGSELINQTSMTVDREGTVLIASYWKEATDRAPQYKLVYGNHGRWQVVNISNRTLDFRLAGSGTKKIPIARPQVLAGSKGIYVIGRDAEMNNRACLFFKNIANSKTTWRLAELTTASLGQWEPGYDVDLWKKKE